MQAEHNYLNIPTRPGLGSLSLFLKLLRGCFHVGAIGLVSELMKSLLPTYCLLVSAGNLWYLEPDRISVSEPSSSEDEVTATVKNWCKCPFFGNGNPTSQIASGAGRYLLHRPFLWKALREVETALLAEMVFAVCWLSTEHYDGNKTYAKFIKELPDIFNTGFLQFLLEKLIYKVVHKVFF